MDNLINVCGEFNINIIIGECINEYWNANA